VQENTEKKNNDNRKSTGIVRQRLAPKKDEKRGEKGKEADRKKENTLDGRGEQTNPALHKKKTSKKGTLGYQKRRGKCHGGGQMRTAGKTGSRAIKEQRIQEANNPVGGKNWKL